MAALDAVSQTCLEAVHKFEFYNNNRNTILTIT